MSATNRILSGSAASWVRIFISIVSQIVLVPVYLSYWPVELYGIWLAIQAVLNILSTLDKGFQNYLGFEFLRLGENRREEIAQHLWSGIWMGIAIGLLQIAIVLGFTLSGFTHVLIGEKAILAQPTLIQDAAWALLFSSIAWLLSGSVGGILGRALTPFGYYPRMSWWGVWATVITSAAPVIAVASGAGLFGAGLVAALATVAYNIPLYADIFRLIKKERIGFVTSSIKLGFIDFGYSLALSGKDLLENARQQGARLILAPLAGAAGVAAFATMRTGANIALQGLGTLTNPLMPELMRFLHQRDQQRTDASFSTVWMIVVVVMSPGVVVFQLLAEPLFASWTRNKIAFNPLLFAVLSLGVLVYAIAQPAITVIRGNNLLRVQVLNSAVSAIVVVGGMVLLVPYFGIVGAGFSLLAAEIITAFLYRQQAKKWLENQHMEWPKKASMLASISVVIAACTMGALIYLPAQYKVLCVAISMVLFLINIKAYITALPPVAMDKIKQIASKLPGLGFLKK